MSDGFDDVPQGDYSNATSLYGYYPQGGNGGGIGERNGLLQYRSVQGGRFSLDPANVTSDTQTSQDVTTLHPEYIAFITKWKRARDVCSGRDAVHVAGEEYLPRLADQPLNEYQAMVKRAGFYNASFRTLAGFVGMLFSKPPNLDVPDQIEDFLNDDVTLSGVNLDTFVKNLCYELLTTSRAGIWVDYPEVADKLDDDGNIVARTVAETQGLNLRPTFSMFTAEQIFNWKFGQVNNKTQLVQVRLYDIDTVDTSEFSSSVTPVIKVLDLDPNGNYRIRKYNRDSGIQIGDEIYPKLNGQTLDYIPFYVATPDGISNNVDDPVLIDLFDLNLDHYRVNADYEHVCHLSAVPTAYIAGLNEKKPIYLGSATVLVFPDPNTNVGYLEISGNGIDAIKDNLTGKEDKMAAIGARMLAPEKAGVEASDTLSMRHNGENSILSAIAISAGTVVARALNMFAQWAGAGDNAKCSYDINRDFALNTLDGPTLTAYIAAVQSGNMSKETLFDLMKRGDLISPEISFEDEQARIDANPPPAPPKVTLLPAGRSKAAPGAPGAPPGPPALTPAAPAA